MVPHGLQAEEGREWEVGKVLAAINSCLSDRCHPALLTPVCHTIVTPFCVGMSLIVQDVFPYTDLKASFPVTSSH